MYTVIGSEVLEGKLSIRLEEVKARSCFIDGELVEKLHAIFLKFDTWITIFFDDGVLFIRDGIDEEPEGYVIEESVFEFPIIDKTEIADETDKILDKEFISFTISEAFDLFLVFKNGARLRIAQEKINQFEFGPTLFEIKS